MSVNEISINVDFLFSTTMHQFNLNIFGIIFCITSEKLARPLLFSMPVWKNSQSLKSSMETLSMSLRNGNGTIKLGSVFVRPVTMLQSSTSKKASPQNKNLSVLLRESKSSLAKWRALIAGVWFVMSISTVAISATTFPNIKHSPGTL